MKRINKQNYHSLRCCSPRWVIKSIIEPTQHLNYFDWIGSHPYFCFIRIRVSTVEAQYFIRSHSVFVCSEHLLLYILNSYYSFVETRHTSLTTTRQNKWWTKMSEKEIKWLSVWIRGCLVSAMNVNLFNLYSSTTFILANFEWFSIVLSLHWLKQKLFFQQLLFYKWKNEKKNIPQEFEIFYYR